MATLEDHRIYTFSARERVSTRVLGQWTPSGLKNTASSVAKHNFKLLSSYNWLSQKVGNASMIAVPGFPAQWNPQTLPKALPADSGLTIRNQNAYRHPKCPLEPLLQALLVTQPSFDFNKIHIICDRNNLRNLFDFVCGKADDFEIAVEMVNNTALFTRLDRTVTEVINPTIDFRGFGHEFEKAFTKFPGVVNGSTGHHRIVQYSFGGLELVVRFEADAAVPANTGSVGSLLGVRGTPTATNSSAQQCSTRIAIRKAGELIPQEHIIEIKTRAAHRPVGVEKCMPQLWFSDTRHLYVGLHQGGAFTRIIKHTVDDAIISAWERKYQHELGKLVDLLAQILEKAKGNKERMKIRCVNGTLKLENWNKRHASGLPLERLPEDLKAKWSPEASDELLNSIGIQIPVFNAVDRNIEVTGTRFEY
ncbi:hypothetical protein BDZ91DRAFT_691221 [Kalaharituber pfeilii]|nr:hypothetical protein BDZ91DRAFT_691221 [Kalaharituber pfeilii]